MFFKNARIYRITKPMAMTAEWLEEQLQADAFKPCGPQEISRQGWVAPLGKHGEQLVHSAGGYHLIALRKEEKLLPPSVIKELVEDRVETIEAEQLRKVRRKEKDEIKEQLTLEMLPRAFSKNRRCFAYLAPKDGILVVDASSAKQAEDLASFLRKSLGSLPVRPPAVEQAPAFTLTGWLSESIDLPEVVTLGDACELKDPSEDGGVVRCKGLDLQGDEIRSHLDAGMQVTKLAVTWDNNLSFTLDEELAIRQLKFGDTLQEKLDDVEADDAVARFDAAFSLMTLELARLIPALLDALGGEDDSAIVDEPSVTEQGEDDELFQDAITHAGVAEVVSVARLQNHFGIGFNRAHNLLDALEDHGVIGPSPGKPLADRKVLKGESAESAA